VGPKLGKHDKVVEKASFEPRCKFAREVNILANQQYFSLLHLFLLDSRTPVGLQ